MAIPTGALTPPSQTTVPQIDYYDDQNILQVDFDALYTTFIQPIDATRSHFNALVPSSKELNTPQYQESRVHAFYRMMGFPVVASNGNFYSPGYDPNLNTDQATQQQHASVLSAITSDTTFLSQQVAPREQIFRTYQTLFNMGGTTAKAVDLGSYYIRSFANQFGSTAPLVYDPAQIQTISDRLTNIIPFYSLLLNATVFGNLTNANLLASNHLLKPFVVDPRIDNGIRPISNRICAPFLYDKSQTKIFSTQTIPRPFIERVISIRYNSQNLLTNPGGSSSSGNQGNNILAQVTTDIEANNNITDPGLLAAITNPLSALHTNELQIFDNYLNTMRAIITAVVQAIQSVEKVRLTINFQPVPDTKTGPETGVNGGNTLDQIVPNDPNNMTYETDIINQTYNSYVNDLSQALDVGLQGVPDPGDFVFPNITDTIGLGNKSVQPSYTDRITSITDLRTQLGNQGITSLQQIEIAMGEFSGLGVLDILAIQAALFIMDGNSLLGLIDSSAYMRAQKRQSINLNNTSQTDVITALTNFEMTLKNIYLVMQGYYDNLNNGTAFNAS